MGLSGKHLDSKGGPGIGPTKAAKISSAGGARAKRHFDEPCYAARGLFLLLHQEASENNITLFQLFRDDTTRKASNRHERWCQRPAQRLSWAHCVGIAIQPLPAPVWR